MPAAQLTAERGDQLIVLQNHAMQFDPFVVQDRLDVW